MKPKKFILLTILFPILTSASVLAAGEQIKGKWIYSDCATCHGQNGEGLRVTNSPRLAGLNDWYLISQLQKFRTGLRGANPEDIYGAQMASMAKVLTDDQALLDVVAYIGTLKPTRPARTETTGDPVRGEKEFNCANCHGLKGQGLKGSYKGIDGPRLSGQHDWYLIRQLENFRAGIRGDLKDKGGLEMRALAKALLTDDQLIRDIVAYIGTLE